jgi:hypothetical protein
MTRREIALRSNNVGPDGDLIRERGGAGRRDRLAANDIGLNRHDFCCGGLLAGARPFGAPSAFLARERLIGVEESDDVCMVPPPN